LKILITVFSISSDYLSHRRSIPTKRLRLASRQALEGMEGESQSGAILILAQLAKQFMDISTEAPRDSCVCEAYIEE